MKEYKPTKKCTLRNIAGKIKESGCQEAKSEYFDVLQEMNIYLYSSDWWFTDQTNETSGVCYNTLTKTKKRRNWLLKYDFIEPVVNLKPCPFCGKTPEVRNDHGVFSVCCCVATNYKNTVGEAFKIWNTRK